MLFAVVTIPIGFFSVLSWSALWGYVASWLNEFIKQDGWPKPLNTIIANGVVVVGATFTTLLVNPAQTLTGPLFVTALLGAFSAALTNHQFFLSPTGIGPALQRATSFVHLSPGAPRATGAYPAPGMGTAAISATPEAKPAKLQTSKRPAARKRVSRR